MKKTIASSTERVMCPKCEWIGTEGDCLLVETAKGHLSKGRWISGHWDRLCPQCGGQVRKLPGPGWYESIYLTITHALGMAPRPFTYLLRFYGNRNPAVKWCTILGILALTWYFRDHTWAWLTLYISGLLTGHCFWGSKRVRV